MNILFLTSRLPFPPIGGDKLRTYHLIKHMKEQLGARITLLSFIESSAELRKIGEYRHLVDDLQTVMLSRSASYANCATGLISRLPLQIHYYASKKMQQLVNKELLNGYEVVFSHLIRMAQYLPESAAIRKVVDFTDAISLNYQRSRSYRTGLFSLINRIEANRVLNYEKFCLQHCDAGIFISEVDAAFLVDETVSSKVAILGNGVDMQRFGYYDGGYDRNQISFVGNMRTFPNTDAVLYFCSDILPRLWERYPEVHFHIVGTEPGKQVRALHDGKRIFVTGFVESVNSYIQNSVCLVAPMRVGAGIQNKILESLALGTPVVTSSIGAEGLEDRELLVANTVEDIIDSIGKLRDNQTHRRKMAVSGRRYIEEQFCWDSVLEPLGQYLGQRHAPAG